MKTITRTILPTLACVLALAATTATAAQAATEGPFYKITGTRLATGATKEITTKNTDNYIIYNTLGPEVECKTQKFASGAELLGSTGANSSSGEATLEFTGCTVGGNGAGCNTVSEPIKTQPLKTALVYLGERTGKLGIYFTPVTKHVFAEIKFNGECKFTKLKVEGSIAAELYSGGKAVEVGKEPAEAAKENIIFDSGIGSVWSEVSGSLVEAEPALQYAGTNVEIEGQSSLELAGGASWGIFT